MYKNVKRTANVAQIVALFDDLIAGKESQVPDGQAQFVKPPQEKKAPKVDTVSDEVEERQYVRLPLIFF